MIHKSGKSPEMSRLCQVSGGGSTATYPFVVSCRAEQERAVILRALYEPQRYP